MRPPSKRYLIFAAIVAAFVAALVVRWQHSTAFQKQYRPVYDALADIFDVVKRKVQHYGPFKIALISIVVFLSAKCGRYLLFQTIPLVVLLKQAGHGTAARLLLQAGLARVTDADGCLPIHVADDEDTLRMLVEAAPDTARAMDKQGRTPLHHAAERSPKFVEILLDVAPETADIADKEGHFPIHLLKCYGAKDVFSRLVNAAPDCLRKPDHAGLLPLHYALKVRNVAVVEDLILRSPDAAGIADNDGRHPLHWAFLEEDELVRYWSPLGRLAASDIGRLIEASPESAMAVDLVMGRTPLCYAVSQRRADLVQILLQKAPAAASIADQKGQLALHIASDHTNFTSSVDVVRCLLQAAPETVAAKDDAGQTALDIALKTNAPLAVLSCLIAATPHGRSTIARMHMERMERDPSSEILPTPFGPAEYGDGFEPQTVLEMQLCRVSAAIRRKPEWRRKVQNEDSVARWREESRELLQDRADEKFDFVIKELRDLYAGLLDDKHTDMAPVDGVYQSESLIDDELKSQLMSGVKSLEESQHVIDWHPGSEQQVRDLVHPSLYPLVFGVSRCIPKKWNKGADASRASGHTASSHMAGSSSLGVWRKHVGGGDIVHADHQAPEQAPSNVEPSTTRSRMSQWLPAEVDVDQDGKVTFLSYINNLHPERHAALYSVLEQVLGRMLPLFSRCLGYMQHPFQNRIVGRITYELFDPSNFTSCKDSDEAEETYREERQLLPLEIPESPTIHAVDYRYPLTGRRLQVIVKLANVELTPEKPKFEGGVWHVEGMENERIVATGIYYYELTNITESRLDFRRQVCEPEHEQDDENGVWTVFNLRDDEPLNQPMGHVVAKEDVCLAFPNMYQHRVEPFELQDKTEPGIRRILVFFLIDPMVRVWSTKDIPPQQRDWYADVLSLTPPFESLPRELVNGVVKHLDWPMSREQAEEYRLKLMEERKYVVRQNNEERFERPFSLCEH